MRQQSHSGAPGFHDLMHMIENPPFVEEQDWTRINGLWDQLKHSPSGIFVDQLQSDEPGDRRFAAWALAEIKDSESVEALTLALTDQDSQVRQYSARALGRMKHQRTAGALLNVLRDPDARVREEAAQALGLLRDIKAVSSLVSSLQDGVAYVRRAAASALGLIGDCAALEALTQALSDQNMGVRSDVANALGLVLSDCAEGSLGGSVAALIRLVRDPEPDVRASAVKALGYAGGPKALKVVRLALADETGPVRASAIRSMSILSPGDALQRAIAGLADPHPDVRRESILSLVLVDDEDRLDLVKVALSDEDDEVRFAAAAMLPDTCVPGVSDLLVKATNDASEGVSSLAEYVLSQRIDSDGPGVASHNGTRSSL